MSNIRYMIRTVINNKERNDNVNIIKTKISNLEIYIDRRLNSYTSFINVCKLINDTGSVILEDDVEICDDFCLIIEDIINKKGRDKVFNFFEKPKSLFPTSYVGGSNFFWMQCIYLPPKVPEKIIKYYDEFKNTQPKKWQGMATDRLIQYALVKEKIKYWRIRPCLVQHLPFKSVIGSRPINRQSPYYIEILKKKGIKYYDLLHSK